MLTLVLTFVKFVADYLEQSWKVVDIKVWHELFTILNQVSNNNLITSHYRLEFLYLAATVSVFVFSLIPVNTRDCSMFKLSYSVYR